MSDNANGIMSRLHSRTEGPANCTWIPNSSEQSPHTCRPSIPPERITSTILSSVLEYIGNTPMIRINRIAKEEGIDCELVGKVSQRHINMKWSEICIYC